MKVHPLLFLCFLLSHTGCRKEEPAPLPPLEFACEPIDHSFVPNGDFENPDISSFCNQLGAAPLLLNQLSPSYNGTKFVQIQPGDSIGLISYTRRIYDNCSGNFRITFHYKVLDPDTNYSGLTYFLSKSDHSQSTQGFIPINTTTDTSWQQHTFEYRKSYGFLEYSCLIFTVKAGRLWLDDLGVGRR